MAEMVETECCALGHLRVGNNDTKDSILHEIREWNKSYDYKSEYLQAHFSVTLTDEKSAEEALKAAGFKKLASFGRRPCCVDGKGDVRTLHLWFRKKDKLD